MQVTFDTTNLSSLDYQVLALLGNVAMSPVDEADAAVNPKADKAVAPKAEAKSPTKPAAKKAVKKPEPEPVEEEEEDLIGDEEPEEDEVSDEDLLELAIKKATEMVAGGDATKVREALDAAGASRHLS